MGIENLKPGASVYLVGIKGTGVCALAELMHNSGMKVSGSDTTEKFYTDEILKELKIPYYENFDATHITKDINIVIHSAAYNAETNPELVRAQEIGLPVIKYTDALGEWSARFDSAGISGVHGKTTTTALCGVCVRALNLPAQVLVGSASFDFGGRSTLYLGDKYFIAETCEYRKHFLSFHPKRIILTSVESDHQDYFTSYELMNYAFIEYCHLLPKGGQLIYCADDNGANEVAQIMKSERSDIELIPYGFTAFSDYKILSYKVENERGIFRLAGFDGEFKLRIPGVHTALNAAAAIALTVLLLKNESGKDTILSEEKLELVKEALENFRSTKRRSEIIGEVSCGDGSIIFMDDYGHHPTAIKTTLHGIKNFYPDRRLIVSFMSHTYTRTAALFEEFASCFNDADILYLHKIYSSAREKYNGTIDGKALFEEAEYERRKVSNAKETFYVDEPDDAFEPISKILRNGDLFITMGAGNNWPLAEKLCSYFRERAL